MPQPFKLAEDRLDDMAVTTEFFIDSTPGVLDVGRLSVRMPNFIRRAEQERLAKVIVAALNADAKRG